MNRSLKTTLLVRTTVASAIVLGCLGVGLFMAMRANLLRNFDGALRAKAQALAAAVEQHEEAVRFDFDPDAMPEFVRGKHPSYFELWRDGKAWRRSPSLGDGDLNTGTERWTRLKDGRRAHRHDDFFAPYG